MCESLLGDLTMVVPLRKEFHGVMHKFTTRMYSCLLFCTLPKVHTSLEIILQKRKEKKRETKRTTSVKLPFIEVKHKQGSTKIPISEHLIVFIIIIFLGHKLASVAASSSECNRAI